MHSTTATWLRDEQHLTDGAARATVTSATALRDDLPGVGGLLADGGITVEHADGRWLTRKAGHTHHPDRRGA